MSYADFYAHGQTTLDEDQLGGLEEWLDNAKQYMHIPKHIVDMLEQMFLMSRCAYPADSFMRVSADPPQYSGSFPTDELTALSAQLESMGVH